MKMLSKLSSFTQAQPLMLLLVFTALFRLIFIDMISTNGDPISYWSAAKSLFSDQGFVPLFHQSVRFGLVGPLYLFQLVFGTSPITYYLMMIIVNIAITWYLYKLILICSNEFNAFIVTLVFILNPILYMKGYAYFMHPYPEPLETLFTLMSFYFLALWRFRKQDLRHVVIAALLMFLAYQAKETSIFMMLGGLFVLRKNWKEFFLYAGLLAVLFLGETLAYRIGADMPLGRISVLAGSHLSESNLSLRVLSSPLQLLNRFIELKYTSIVFFFLFFALTPYYLLRHRSERILLLLAAAWSFIIPITVAIKSLNPIQLALPFNTRYMNISLPYVIAIDLMGILLVIESARRIKIPEQITAAGNRIIAVVLTLILLTSTIFVMIKGENSTHRLVSRYNIMIDEAVEQGLPIVSLAQSDNRQHKQLKAALCLFADSPEWIHTPIIRHTKFPRANYVPTAAEKKEPDLNDPVILVFSNPFRAERTTLKEALERR